MSKIKLEQLQRHLKTHTERSNDDRNAISVLQTFLRSDGKINHNFACNDKWPNIIKLKRFYSYGFEKKQSFFQRI